jgi:primosomal protein N' (replication factor Y) (superfamily II helicase)
MPVFFLEVAFPIPIDKTFHYAPMPGDADGKAANGRRVLAPFGKGKPLVGYVVGVTEDVPPFATKPITAFLDPAPVISSELLQLARWLADHYLCSWGEALACIWPAVLAAPKRRGGGRSVEGEESVKILSIPSIPSLRSSPSSLCLTVEQQRAVNVILPAIDAGRAKTFLVHGVTDSGKTEIYLQAIDHALSKNKQALYLLPEIAMTPPFLDQLKARYGADKVGLWHSGLTPNERYRVWTAVQRGELHVLLGARSAVFAPFPRLGALILDEEHEPSYKQEDRPRYHTREVALKRSALESCVLILGSATPSLESYWNAKQGTYQLLELKERVEKRSLPRVTLVDRQAVKGRRGAPLIFSESLHLALEQRLARREQALLFVNRRGFTPFLRCSNCGWVARCSRCSLTMAIHMAKPSTSERAFPNPNETELVCHGCLKREKAPVECPACKKLKLRLFGIGTQRIERELQRLFPFAKVERLDSDTGRSSSALERIVRSFARGETDILVGTQMIAKGFDFPRVTLVGVVDADVSLHLPDFRAAERTFDLIAQVAGRSGRGERPGEVFVQTHYPEHEALQNAKSHDYAGFYEREIIERRVLNYPPFCRLVRLIVRAPKEASAQAAAQLLAARLDAFPDLEVLGPAPAAHLRLRGQFRYQALIKGSPEALILPLRLLKSLRLPKAFLIVDVDPQDML